MGGSESGYRPNLVFAVTVLLLLVAGACVVIWIGRASEVRADVLRVTSLEDDLSSLYEKLKPLEPLAAADVQVRLGAQDDLIKSLGERFAALESRLNAIKTPVSGAAVSSEFEREVRGLEGQLRTLQRRLSEYRTPGAQKELDRRQDTRLAEIEGNLAPRSPAPDDQLGARIGKLESRVKELRQASSDPQRMTETEAADAAQEVLKRLKSLKTLPPGTILSWLPPKGSRGSPLKPPAGWAICDGKKGTPDLSGRVLLGTTSAKLVGKPGGTLRMGPHYHHRSAWNHPRPAGDGTIRVLGARRHSDPKQTYWLSASDDFIPDLPAPPHVKIVYIMKLP